METITSKNFENYYGVSLLPYSEETTQIGEVMYEKGLFNRTLEYQNETILDVSGISASQRANYQKQLLAVPLNEAQFPNITLNHSFNGNEGLKIPIINLDVSADVKTSKNVSLTLTNVKSKRLFGSLKFTLKNLIDTSKAARKELRHKLIITQLFYADSVVLKASHGIDANINASLNAAKIKGVTLQSQNNGDGSANYTFSGMDQCPFAAQLIKLKNF